MEQYISKAALVAEIEKIIADENESIKCFERRKNVNEVQRSNARIGVLVHIRSLLDTFEAKEVDLQKEIDRVWDNTSDNFSEDGWKDFEEIAKHFFELGLKASNPLTWEDMLIIHKCIKDAMNYHLYAFQSVEGQQKVYEEVLKRFKAMKGE